MSYDFDTVIPRRGTASVKWDLTDNDVIPLWVADMDFAAPPEVIDAVRQRLEHPVFGYTVIREGYREAFRSWQRRRNGIEIESDWLLATPAVMPAVRAAIDALSSPGDGVVVQSPVYFPFFDAVRSKGRTLRLNPLRESDLCYEMDLDHLERLFRAGARLLLFCSPHNPVARVWNDSELTALAELTRRYDVAVISDEIHSDVVFRSAAGAAGTPGAANARFQSMLQLVPERTVACFSVSKTFNLAGIGASQTVVPDPVLRERLSEVLNRDDLSSIRNTLSLVATEAAYRHGDRWLDELLQYLEDNWRLVRDRLTEELPGVSVTPQQGTCIAWIDFRGYLRDRGMRDAQLGRLLLRDARVRISPGVQFGRGGYGFQRLNFGTSRNVLLQALDRITQALA